MVIAPNLTCTRVSHFHHVCLNGVNMYYHSYMKNNYPLASYSLRSRNIMAVLMHYLLLKKQPSIS